MLEIFGEWQKMNPCLGMQIFGMRPWSLRKSSVSYGPWKEKKTGLAWKHSFGKLQKVLKLFPAVLVVYDSSNYGKLAKGVFDERMRFRVLVASRNLRGEKATRRGDVAMVGTYQMLRDVRGLLANQSLGLDVGPAEPVVERFVVNTREASIYEAVYETRVDFAPVP